MRTITIKRGDTLVKITPKLRSALLAELGRIGGSKSTTAKRQAAFDREARKRKSRGTL